MIPTIEIHNENRPSQPTVRLSETTPGSIWQYTGVAIGRASNTVQRHVVSDLNTAAELAAAALAKKVSSRNIHVELIINPLIPPVNVANDQILPLVTAIAENASASVEPGPGTVTLRTWASDKFVGVDAIGMGGILPSPIRENLTRPGFTTRIGDWDTGFGLHSAMEAAIAIAARIELFEPDGSVGFRLAIPLKQGSPLEPSELRTAIAEPDVSPTGLTLTETDQLSCHMLPYLEGRNNVFSDGIIQA